MIVCQSESFLTSIFGVEILSVVYFNSMKVLLQMSLVRNISDSSTTILLGILEKIG